MKRFKLFLLLLLIAQISVAQTDSLSVFQTRANALFEDGNYNEAADWCQKIIETDPNNAQAYFRLGYCYLQSGETVAQSVQYFDKAYALYSKDSKPEEAQTALFYKAQAYHKSYQFDEAETIYNELIEISQNQQLTKRVKEELLSVENAKEYFFSPQPLQVTRYGILNSGYDDHSPVISVDEEVLMFTSKRPGNIGGLTSENGEPYEDIYVFRKSQHPRPVNIGHPVNTQYHDATCGLSIDGNLLFIYRATKRDGGDIFQSRYDGEKWSEPVRLGPNINTKYRETHASLSADEQFLYITSDRKGGYGGFDIYVSERQADSTWGPAKNLGPEINTPKNEIGPYIHPDGYTLYFSSDGHPGMGGYDVFLSEKKLDGGWYEPENIGFPLNTVEHDVFFVPTADGKGGYYASQKDGSTNIYKATFLAKPEKSMTLIAGYARDTKVDVSRVDIADTYRDHSGYKNSEGTVYPEQYSYSDSDGMFKKAYCEGAEVVFRDSICNIPQNTRIYLIDVQTGDSVQEYSAANHNGRFLIITQEQKDYKLIFEADGYVFDAFDIKKDQQKGFFRLDQNAELDNINEEYLRATRTIGFEVGLTTLNEFAKTELDYLSQFLHQNPALQIDISGCDYLVYDANPDYRRLECEYAEARKRKVTQYLENKGIEPGRMRGNMFPVHHTGDTLAYTIFNEKQAQKEEEIKTHRKETFHVVQTEANLSEEEILTKYGTVSVRKEPYVTENMRFEINQHKSNRYDKSLKELAKYLKTDSEAHILLTGYTDMQGNKTYNYKLSEKRAAFVKSELIRLGADSSQISVEGKGFENPIAKNKTTENEFYWEALEYNRRVEITVIQKSAHAELFVKQIEMPAEYLYQADIDDVADKKQFYSVGLLLTKQKQSIDDFKAIDGISEKHYADGRYLYFFGKFKKREKALDEFHKVKADYPDAFIFIR